MRPSGRLFLLLAGALAVFFIYRPGLGSQFLYDDIATIVHNPYLKEESLIRAMSFNPFRSVVYLTFDIQYHLGYDEETRSTLSLPFHLFNLVLHCANAALFFLALARAGLGKKSVHIAAAAVFLVHPLCTEAVNFVSARFTLMATLFYLAAIYFHLDPAEKKASSFLFWLMFILGLACKETVATLPLSIFLINHVRKRPQKRAVAGLILVAAYILLRLNWTIVLTIHEEKSLSPLSYFLFENFSMWLYLWKGLFPVHLNFDHNIGYHPAAFAALAVINLAVLAVLVRAIVKRSAWPLIPLLFIAVMLPTSSFIPLDDTFRETRAYLATALTSLALAWLIFEPTGESGQRARIRLAAFLLILLVFCGLTLRRNTAWSSPASLWRDTVTKSPMKHRPQYNYACALRRELELEKALRQYQRAYMLDPEHMNTIRNLELVKKALVSPDLEKWKEELRSRSR